jgi:hypothetical protein
MKPDNSAPLMQANASPVESIDMDEVVFTSPEMRIAAEALWGLLDDIDSASDMIKPTNLEGYKKFYDYAMRKSEERHKFLRSDGYKLAFNKECATNVGAFVVSSEGCETGRFSGSEPNESNTPKSAEPERDSISDFGEGSDQ